MNITLGLFIIAAVSGMHTFNTPPRFKPGDASSLINLVGISRVIFEFSDNLKKST